MTQRNNGKRKKAPAYSADTLALRYFLGLALIALGVVAFLAVDLHMRGTVFEGLADVCYGLTGSLAVVLPLFPVWAGVLAVWSAQSKAPVKPWLFAMLAFIGLCSFLVLITRIGPDRRELLADLSGMTGGGWADVVRTGYSLSADLKQSGGAAGILLAWPLWRYLGTVLGAVILFLLTLLCILLALNLTPGRLRDLMTGKAKLWDRKRRESREAAEQQQIAWQQEQARREQAWQQQQAAIIQQQQWAAQAGQGNNMPQQPYPPQYTPAQGYTGTQFTTSQNAAEAGGIAEWQRQMTAQTDPAQGKPHVSRLFGRKKEEPAHAGEPARKSRIFGKKEEYDGLSDSSEEDKLRAGFGRNAGAGRRPAAETAAPGREERGRDVRTDVRPAAAENSAGKEGAYTRTEYPDRERQNRGPAAESRAAERPERTGRSPAAVSRTAEEEPVTVPRKPAVRPAVREQESVLPAAEKTDRPGGTKQKEENLSGADREPSAKPAVPVVTQTIGEETWKPVLKDVPLKSEAGEDSYWEPTLYTAPPITDLKMPEANRENTAEEDLFRSRRLEETLASFRVQARVVNVTHGPAISRFELELASGTKVNKVAELEKDIAYGMEATSVRIEAPIPGKSLVGVEVPNRKVATVTLREVLQSEKMQNAKSILTVALGKDIAGTPIVCDLAKMPHMLIAGATGSGKSVCINAIINSLLYRAGPDEVRMILIDPKVVELQCYNGIPHLLIPVVNDPHKASAALAWAVAEMMDRYDKFAQRKVRNVDGYNGSLGEGEKPMPRIVIIIDELADLMMVCKKDVEEYICRLTQLARAAGIHLIVATQRPSVDVITGLIKANIPSRIAFKTASYVDSRTILDRNGSEQLLGYGDMLYLPTGSFAPTRIQGCFLSDDEVNRIAKHVRDANPSTPDPNILEWMDKQISGGESTGADMIGGNTDAVSADGDLFEQAVEFAIADGQISTSTLQRRLKVGYARAGRLTDEMEERGIVSAKDGSKPRKCLITREEWENIKKSTEGMI